MSASASNLVPALVDKFFESRQGELYVGGVSVSSLAERHGTPLFLYDCGVIDQKLRALQHALTSNIEIYYSVKANPNPAILRRFVSHGCGLEIASAGELLQALAAGCRPQRILFAGPGKTDRELEMAIGEAIGEIHVESPGEAIRLSELCERRGRRTGVSVRINPSAEVQGGAMRMGGKSAPFGVDEEKMESLMDFITGKACFEFCGIHVFSGTQILDHTVLLQQFRRAVEIARRVALTIGRPLKTVDFGGGFGIPYFNGETELDLAGLSRELAAFLTDVRSHPDFRGTRFIVEPGRFLVGEAGVYVARITDIKESRGKTFLILDGGMNHHLAASGNLGQTIKRNYPIALIQKLGQRNAGCVDVVGPLCTPLDTVGRDVLLPEAATGDLVGIFQSGAYARTASPLMFLSRNSPAEVCVENGMDMLIRPHGRAEDFLEASYVA
jgi:diaminopimelate decarboxylase